MKFLWLPPLRFWDDLEWVFQDLHRLYYDTHIEWSIRGSIRWINLRFSSKTTCETEQVHRITKEHQGQKGGHNGCPRDIQGDTRHCSLCSVDIKSRVANKYSIILANKYKEHILQRNFLISCQQNQGSNVMCHPVVRACMCKEMGMGRERKWMVAWNSAISQWRADQASYDLFLSPLVPGQ